MRTGRGAAAEAPEAPEWAAGSGPEEGVWALCWLSMARMRRCADCAAKKLPMMCTVVSSPVEAPCSGSLITDDVVRCISRTFWPPLPMMRPTCESGTVDQKGTLDFRGCFFSAKPSLAPQGWPSVGVTEDLFLHRERERERERIGHSLDESTDLGRRHHQLDGQSDVLAGRHEAFLAHLLEDQVLSLRATMETTESRSADRFFCLFVFFSFSVSVAMVTERERDGESFGARAARTFH